MKRTIEEYKNLPGFDKEAYEKDMAELLESMKNMPPKGTDPALLVYDELIRLLSPILPLMDASHTPDELIPELEEMDSTMHFEFTISRGAASMIIPSIVRSVLQNYKNPQFKEFHVYEEEILDLIRSILRELLASDVQLAFIVCRTLAKKAKERIKRLELERITSNILGGMDLGKNANVIVVNKDDNKSEPTQ